jgi:hypothetical protein
MGDNEPELVQLWREKRGEIEPEDLFGNLILSYAGDWVTRSIRRRGEPTF